MTINTWRNEILKICRTCGYFDDTAESRYRYKCRKYSLHIYDCHACVKTMEIREKASRISSEELDKAFSELTGGCND